MQNVIAESGSALEHWALDEDPLDSAYAIAVENGCEDEISGPDDIDGIYGCMMNLTMEVIAVGINDLSV